MKLPNKSHKQSSKLGHRQTHQKVVNTVVSGLQTDTQCNRHLLSAYVRQTYPKGRRKLPLLFMHTHIMKRQHSSKAKLRYHVNVQHPLKHQMHGLPGCSSTESDSTMTHSPVTTSHKLKKAAWHHKVCTTGACC